MFFIADRPLRLETQGTLIDAFAESELPRRVDVVDWATTSDAFHSIIERDKVVVRQGAGGPETEFRRSV